jgi:hypothetical protein
MAHFAELTTDNAVLRVIVVDNINLIDNSGNETEDAGILFCKSIFGENTIWKQTSYNKSFRKNYAGEGYIYDSFRDAFIPPKIFNSWILNDNTCQWEAPIPYPSDGQVYFWSDDDNNWKQFI